MSELFFDSDGFEPEVLDNVAGRALSHVNQVRDLLNRTIEAAGTGSDGASFLGSLRPSMDEALASIQGVHSGIEAGMNTLKSQKKILTGVEEANALSVPETIRPATPAERENPRA